MDQLKVKQLFEVPHEGDELTCTARQEIDGDIDKLERTIILLKTKRNQLSPIFVLPAEVLSSIFTLIRDQCINFWFSKCHISWMHITRVCHHWREVALGCPSLWTAPIFSYPDLAQEMVRRSQMAVLTIKSRSTQWDPRVLKGLENAMGQIHRIESIKLALDCIEKFQTILSPLSQPAPLLKKIALTGTLMGQFPFPVGALSDAPRLRSVKFTSLNFSWESAVLRHKNLTNLSLADNHAATDGTSSFNQMMDALRYLPNLHALKLNNCIPPYTTSNRDEKILEFRFLERLDLRAEAADLVFLLPRIQYPPQATIELYFSSPPIEDSHTIFSVISQNLYRTKSTETHCLPVIIQSLQLTSSYSNPTKFVLSNRVGAFTSTISICLDNQLNFSRAYAYLPSLYSCFDFSLLQELSLNWAFAFGEIDTIRDSFRKSPKLEIITISQSLLEICHALVESPKDSRAKGSGKHQTRYPPQNRKLEDSSSPFTIFPALRTLIVTGEDFRQRRNSSYMVYLIDMLSERSNMNAPIDTLRFEQCRGLCTWQKRGLAELVVDLVVEGKVIDMKELDADDNEEDEEDYSDEEDEKDDKGEEDEDEGDRSDVGNSSDHP